MVRRILATLRRMLLEWLVVALLYSVDAGLRWASYKRVHHWLARLSPNPSMSVINIEQAASSGRFVNRVAARRYVQATCLRRSLVLWWLLRWRGIPSGVQIAFGQQGGHAWVEHDGVVINDAPDVVTRYSLRFGDELVPEKVAEIV